MFAASPQASDTDLEAPESYWPNVFIALVSIVEINLGPGWKIIL